MLKIVHRSPFTSVCLVAMLCAFNLPVNAQNAVLDGKIFIADAGEKGKPADEKADVITFKDGKFHSSQCDQYGYGKGDYKASSQGDSVSFEVQTQSEQYGRNDWKGVVKGNQIEGTMIFHRKATWWRPNPEPLEHWFKGSAVP